MLKLSQLGDLCDKIKQNLPEHVALLQADLSKNGRLIMHKLLSACKLVSREEFDVQAKVLARTRDKLQDLEAMVKKMDNKAQDTQTPQ